MLARAPIARASWQPADAASTSLLEEALAQARGRAVTAELKIVELERAVQESSITARRAEERANALGERAARNSQSTSSTLECDAVKNRCEALETANARLREALKQKTARVDELEAEVSSSRRDETQALDDEDVAKRAEQREREIVRLRQELSRQAQVIADAYRDEIQKLQSALAESQSNCEKLTAEVEEAKKRVAAQKASRGKHEYRMFESPYAYAKYSEKTSSDASRARTPLTPRDENVFERLATPKRVASPRRLAPSPRDVR